MSNLWSLPVSLNINGTFYKIRTDYRVILDILHYYEDPDYEEDERHEICKRILYIDWKSIPLKDTEEALIKAMWFIGGGSLAGETSESVKLMDWEQDANLIIPAINRVTGTEIRALEYMHWWTFISAYMEIGDSLFSTILQVRRKKAKGKTLDDAEKSFYRDYKNLIDLRKRYSQEDLEEQKRLNAILG